MDSVMNTEVLSKLELLAQKLGANSTEVFSWYVKQQYITVFGIFALVVVFAVLSYLCTKWYSSQLKYHNKLVAENKKKSHTDDGTNLSVIFGIITAFIAIVAFIFFLCHLVGLLNVEYYAFQDLMGTISKVVP